MLGTRCGGLTREICNGNKGRLGWELFEVQNFRASDSDFLDMNIEKSKTRVHVKWKQGISNFCKVLLLHSRFM